MLDLVGDVQVIVAGTEPITRRVLDRGRDLKLISRVGIGLDNVNLCEARRRGIAVSYTPDAPSSAVAELTLGLLLGLLRSTHISNLQMRANSWTRFFGQSVEDIAVGIIGAGRIGSRVIELLNGIGVTDIAVCDPERQHRGLEIAYGRWTTHEDIYQTCDAISLHVPMNPLNRGMVGYRELSMMKRNALLINTARGGIVDEHALVESLDAGMLGGVALDVFEREPYQGPLIGYDRVMLTAHLGSMTQRSRNRMEIEACQDVVRFLSGEALVCRVADEEYESCAVG